MIKAFDIILDTKKEVQTRIHSINTNDLNVVQFFVTVNDKGVPKDLTGATSARLAVRKPDGKSVYLDGTITNAAQGKISFTLTSQAVIASGNHTAEVMIYKGTTMILVPNQFIYHVTQGVLGEESLKSTNDWGILNSALEAGEAFEGIDIPALIASGPLARTAATDANTATANANIVIETMDGLITNAQTIINQTNTAKENAETATAAANAAANNLGGNAGDYNAATSYLKNNIVSYLGSSYINILPSKGVLPTNTTNWRLLAAKGDIGPIGLTGATGATGIQGIQGLTGPPLYTWIKYGTSAAGAGMTDTPDANTTHIGIATNKATATKSTTASDYTWSQFKGNTGNTGLTGSQGIQGIQGVAGATLYTWIKYGTSAAGAGITDDPAGMTYIGIAANKTTATKSTVPGDYTWSLIKGDTGATGSGLRILGTFATTAGLPATGAAGDGYMVGENLYVWNGTGWANAGPIKGQQGDPGIQGIQGIQGIAGATLYTWIKYGTSAAGAGMTDTPDGTTTHIGIATNKNTATKSTTASDYTWSQFKGDTGNTGLTGSQGIQGIQGIQGVTGTAGKTILNGTATPPTAGTGTDGDFYLNTTTSMLYGPKAAGAWPAGKSLIGAQGIQGIQGVQGIQGTVGTAGKTILSGTATPPVAGTGTDGDFYLNTTTSMLYGPKAAGAWPAGKSLIGAQGIQGPAGAASTTSIIESRTSDPASPAVGQIWFRSDL